MSFGGNTQPKRFGQGKPKSTGPTGWLCGCGITQSRFVLYCSRCNRGQKAAKE